MVLIRSAQGVVALTGAVIVLFTSSMPQAEAKTKKSGKSLQTASTGTSGTRHKKIRRIASNSNNYLVPPPPAYTPAWLPEGLYAPNTEPVKTEPANPYSKYIYTAPGHDSVSPQRPNKYVTYWSKT